MVKRNPDIPPRTMPGGPKNPMVAGLAMSVAERGLSITIITAKD
jgi:hypothetical protein